MISQHQFNNVLKELNASFAALAERVEKLEKEVKDGRQQNHEREKQRLRSLPQVRKSPTDRQAKLRTEVPV